MNYRTNGATQGRTRTATPLVCGSTTPGGFGVPAPGAVLVDRERGSAEVGSFPNQPAPRATERRKAVTCRSRDVLYPLAAFGERRGTRCPLCGAERFDEIPQRG